MSENQSIPQSSVANDTKKEKFLIFCLNEERYGIPLSTVKEIIGMVEITPVPQVPDFFKGLINLRGEVLSVIDLKVKLSLTKDVEKSERESIIIVEIDGFKLGTIVDDVDEVVGFDSGQLEKSLDIQSTVDKKFVSGVAKIDQQLLVLLLNIGNTLSIDEMKMIREKSN